MLKTKDGDSVITKEAGLCELDLWPRESKVKEELFTERGYFKPYKMKFYDLPHIVTQSLEGMEFIEALARTSDTSLFGLRSVQSIIHLHWMFWRKWEVFLRLIPFFAQILTFFLWSNFLLPTKADPYVRTHALILRRYHQEWYYRMVTRPVPVRGAHSSGLASCLLGI